jgi:hypothetical protein
MQREEKPSAFSDQPKKKAVFMVAHLSSGILLNADC